jgi:hypothetical protein
MSASITAIAVKVGEKLARKAGLALWRWSYRRAVDRQRLRDVRPSDDLDNGDDKPVVRIAED